MLADTLMAPAALAGNTVVAAATTDASEATRRGFAQLLGRDDPDRTAVTERGLAETHQQLTATVQQGLEQARAAAAFRPGQIAVNHGTGDPQLHERGKHAAGRLADTAHLLARSTGAGS
jgi:hypothetical protein